MSFRTKPLPERIMREIEAMPKSHSAIRQLAVREGIGVDRAWHAWRKSHAQDMVCDCGNRAVALSPCGPVCARCRDIEDRQFRCKESMRAGRHNLYSKYCDPYAIHFTFRTD